MFKSLKEKLSGWLKKVSGKGEKINEIEEPEDHNSIKPELEKKIKLKREILDEQKTGIKPKTGNEIKNDEQKIIIKNKDQEIAIIESLDILPILEIQKSVSPEIDRIIEKISPQIPEGQELQREEKNKKQTNNENQEKKKGFFTALKEKFTTKKISEDEFRALFDDLEGILIENNVALEVIDVIRKQLQANFVGKDFNRGEIEEILRENLRDSVNKLLIQPFDILQILNKKTDSSQYPFVILFFGINGSGKTTTIAKVAYALKEKRISCVLAAADTFRAASIEQLNIHGDHLGVKVIKHDYGSDPAAVAFDAIKYAKQHGIKAVLIDTAGRMHTKENLMREMQKISKVAKPDLKIFIGESITGNDAVEQAKKFHEALGIDGIILSKADVDEKGGTAISVGYITGKPILYLGTGQKYTDLEPFQKDKLIKSLGL